MINKPALLEKVNLPICLAPMVGLSHVALRLLVRDYLPKGAFTIWPTEMLNSRKIPDEEFGHTPESKRSENEEGMVPQILGNEESFIARSLEKLEAWGAEGVDINMGCPVQKALRHNYGVALMGDAKYAAEVVRMTVRNSKIPVSVKLRAASEKSAKSGKSGASDLGYLEDFVGGLVDAGASWVCLHPRTAEQKRRGNADWSQIRFLKERMAIPIIGNGDVQTAEDFHAMRRETNCDLVMVGRALAARPWMLWQLGEDLGFQPSQSELVQSGPVSAPRTPEEEGQEYGRALLQLIENLRYYFSEDLAVRKLRFHVRTTSVWLDFGHSLHSAVTKAKTLNDIQGAVREFFKSPVTMALRTQLRE